MSKVTSKLQVTLPKAIATQYGVAPGADLIFEPAGESIRVLVAREPSAAASAAVGSPLAPADRTELLQAMAQRQTRRNRRYRLKFGAAGARGADDAASRGWTREDLNDRARAR